MSYESSTLAAELPRHTKKLLQKFIKFSKKRQVIFFRHVEKRAFYDVLPFDLEQGVFPSVLIIDFFYLAFLIFAAVLTNLVFLEHIL